MTQEYEDLKKSVAAQRKVAARKRKILDAQLEILAQLLEDCPHEELQPEKSYYPGSYLDKAYTHYWNKCTLCGKKSEETTEMHSWYG